MKDMPKAVIFTDLDGTFLDHASYDYKPALPAFRRCLELRVPVVFCSSKTRAEIDRLRGEIGSADPYVVENGGAAFIPPAALPFPFDCDAEIDGYRVLEFGIRYQMLIACFDEVRNRTGCDATGFHDWDAERIAREADLSLEVARLASQREFDEPFLFPNGETNPSAAEDFLRTIEAAGLRWTRGGRFYHLLGHGGKQPAVSALTRLYRRQAPDVVTVGLGDSGNDISLLETVDRPILVPKLDGTYDAAVLAQVERLEKAPLPGPRGWNVAVTGLLEELAGSGAAA